jgi:hypothetical protein
VCQYHTFRKPGGARSIDQRSHSLGAAAVLLDWLGLNLLIQGTDAYRAQPGYFSDRGAMPLGMLRGMR